MTKPNVLWIMTDQHRADCLGFMGHPVIQTPHLDRLAARGVVFENAFCQSPACIASRAVLFTGRYPAAVRVRGMGVLPPAETTFPEVLRRNGYRTGAFGKVHLTPEQYTRTQLNSEEPCLDWRRYAADSLLTPAPEDPIKENYGFETHVGCEDILQGRFRAWLREVDPALLDRRPEPFHPAGPRDLWVSPYPSAYHPSTFIADQAAQFIEQCDRAAPWFTFCSFVAPHHPFEAPADQLARYEESRVPVPEHKGGVEPSFVPPPAAEAIGEWDRYPAEVQRRIVCHYLASISLIDDGVGRLLAALQASGEMDNTLIVFTSDHGEFLGNHGLLRKPSLHYDETLRVPLVIRLPGAATTGRRVPGLVELTDLHPTLIGLLGLPINPGVQGHDWSQAIQTGSPIGREDIYSDMFDITPQRFGELQGPYMAVLTLRTEHWKLNLYPTAGPQYGQLFDLRNDPDESRNRYGDPTHREVRTELLWRLLSRHHQMADPLPLYLTQY
ncbi:sulfatase-like hydrolase/transferase [bacterium]|nr:sulfatase-like hydrolase/transferase [bacterium]